MPEEEIRSARLAKVVEFGETNVVIVIRGKVPKAREAHQG